MPKGDGQRPADDKPRFFGRRRGKTLRRNAQGLMETLLPRLAVTPPGSGEPPLDPAGLFARPVRAAWLEIGFGGGEHAVAQAGLHPDIGLIACEPFVNGIASLLGHLAGSAIDNIRIFGDDVRQLLPAFPAASLERVFVLFPDPWPKKRHAERRFIGRGNLDALARVMADGAELRVASDDPVYQDWATAQLRGHEAFVEIQLTSERASLPADWPVTRYEQKCLAGRDPVFFRFARKNRA
mgnify:CR=1 FL=1